MSQTIDLAAYRRDGTVAEKTIPTADELDARGHREIAWELRRIDLMISLHERNQRDWAALLTGATSEELADFLADSIDRETFKITRARMLREIVLRGAGERTA